MIRKIFITSIFILAVLLAGVNVASAHCDTMDGPVVKASREALDTGRGIRGGS